MPKALLSNRIYLEATPELRQALTKELTYVIPPRTKMGYPETIRNLKPFKKNIVSIPIGRTDLIPKDYEIVDKRVINDVEFPDFKGVLRPSQQDIWDDIDDSAMINAWVSFGKTFTALAIAGKWSQKTLVVTHTVQLRRQWEKEIEKVYGFTPGVIGSSKFELDSPIVVANVQTLYNHMDKLYKEFGCLIMDEFHHVSAPTFTKVIDKCSARYKIGLSGTMQRKDGKHIVFKDYFGSQVYRPPVENFMPPEIHIYKTPITLPDSDLIPWAKKINTLSENEEYQHLLAILAAKYAAEGHKVLLVASRVKLLQVCAELIGDNATCVTGGSSEEERQDSMDMIAAGEKEVLCGTQSMFSEGISLDELSCIVLGTPINNEPLLIQLIGRIGRVCEGKKKPVVVDIGLRGNTAKKQAAMRAGVYMKQGWDIKEDNV